MDNAFLFDIAIRVFDALAARGISHDALRAEWAAARAEGRPIRLDSFQEDALEAQKRAHEAAQG